MKERDSKDSSASRMANERMIAISHSGKIFRKEICYHSAEEKLPFPDTPIFFLLSSAKLSSRLAMSKDHSAISRKSSFFSGIPKKRVFPRNSLHIASRTDGKSIGKKKKNWGDCALVTPPPAIVRTIKKQTS